MSRTEHFSRREIRGKQLPWDMRIRGGNGKLKRITNRAERRKSKIKLSGQVK